MFRANTGGDIMYNGWKNKATWNVALWINNDESLYNMAHDYANSCDKPTYLRFIHNWYLSDDRTPDGFKFGGQKLDYKALNEMLLEIKESH
jgi:hypothetical protein